MHRKISWINDAVFYHIYPLGLCDAPLANDYISEPVNRLGQLLNWIPHIKNLGCNALYLGPVFESDFHGYDTADYYKLDRRLGRNQNLKELSDQLHLNGIRLIPDAVFNHVGRNFFAFRDLQVNREGSVYKDWFTGVDFTGDNIYGDGFSYEGWFDAYNLVKLNLTHPGVRQYLFDVVAFWMAEFKIDGLRLDVAEIMDKQFLTELGNFCHNLHPDFWLMGEVIQGDYTQWANDDVLDSTTNYEGYKALYSSQNDRNYFEIAHTLNRQFGPGGVYKELLLYNFADNHDTSRISTILSDKGHLFPVYAILFTMPGIPSIYYGSEWGLEGLKGEHDDIALRPAVKEIPELTDNPLFNYIKRLIDVRQHLTALRFGDYRELFVAPLQLVFERYIEDELFIIAVNGSAEPASINLSLQEDLDLELYDVLDTAFCVSVSSGQFLVDLIPAYSARILVPRPIVN